MIDNDPNEWWPFPWIGDEPYEGELPNEDFDDDFDADDDWIFTPPTPEEDSEDVEQPPIPEEVPPAPPAQTPTDDSGFFIP